MTLKRYLSITIPLFTFVAIALFWQDMNFVQQKALEFVGIILGYAVAGLAALWCVVRIVRHAWGSR